MNRRSILTGAAAAMTVVGALAVAPGPAQAAYTCGQQQVCFYKDYNATGTASVQARLNRSSGTAFVGYIKDFRNSHYTNGETLQDSISSIVNNSDDDMLLYDEGNFGGPRVLIPRHSGLRNLDSGTVYGPNGKPVTYLYTLNDRATSAAVGSCTTTACTR